MGDWLSTDAVKFPEGMKTTADSIKEAGMIPGIWLAPFVCEEKSAVCKEHPDWIVRDKKGEKVRGGSNWSGFYALDIYNEEVREYLRQVFDVIVNVWGYKLLKLDFLYAACIVPREDKTRGRIMADGMGLLRELSGDALILGCGVPTASAFGTVDYCRIGTDVSLDWDDKRPSTKNSILNSVFRRQLSGRAFINDPDVFLLRDSNTSMTAEQKRTLAAVNALCGGVLFTSDNFAEYGQWQKDMLSLISRLRGSKVLCADIDGRELVITAEKDGITGIYRFTV